MILPRVLLLMVISLVLGSATIAGGEVLDSRQEALRSEQRRVDLQTLPIEARETLQLIDQGGPFVYARDGINFGNREILLPRRPLGYYREYTVPTPGSRHRGARRIVVGDGAEFYYTDDHYRSFRRITGGKE